MIVNCSRLYSQSIYIYIICIHMYHKKMITTIVMITMIRLIVKVAIIIATIMRKIMIKNNSNANNCCHYHPLDLQAQILRLMVVMKSNNKVLDSKMSEIRPGLR